MSQWGFFFNQNRCLGCKTCILACKNWNDERRGDIAFNTINTDIYQTPPDKNEPESSYIDAETGTTNYALFSKHYMKESWRRVDTIETGATALAQDNTFAVSLNRRYLTIACNHCDDPACVKACPMGAIHKESTIGAVLVTGSACISCGKCRSACPWEAPQFYDENFAKYQPADPLRPRMTKCTFCLDRINEGLKPACVASCWNRALDAGPIEELRKKYMDKGYRVTDTIAGEFEDNSTAPNIIFAAKGS